MEKGTLVEFRHHTNDRLLAVVQGLEGKKNLVLKVASGQTHSIHPRQITFTIPTSDPYTSQDIPNFLEEVEPLLDPDSLAIAWELLQEERRALPLADIAQILFSSTAPTTLYATFRLLSEDRVYFKQKGEAYEPRSQSQVQEIQNQLLIQQQKEQEQAQFEAKLGVALKQAESVSWTELERRRLEVLERFALYGEEASDRDQALKLLMFLERTTSPQAAFDTLVDLGLWNRHENLALRLSSIPTHFTPDLEQLADHLIADPPPDLMERRDLTHLHTYTIDDASTRDIDDALSVEWLADARIRIWIHIADPTRWIPLGHPLDHEARKRGTSVYLPEQVLPMFPAQLATGPMSLVQGQVRAALSFGIVLSQEGAIAECCIYPSLIQVTYRLTYDDADEMLQLAAEKDLTLLAEAAQLRYQWRSSQGAINIGLPEQDIKVVDGVPHLQVLEDTPSRQLVAEMMVLTGEATAAYTAAAQLPFLYRSQPEPDLPPPEELSQLPPGPVYSFALMRCMQKAEMTTVPGAHAGLGLAAYSQVTSPIRRYADLIGHWQLKAHLRGEPPLFTQDQLRQMIIALEPTTTEAIQVERRTKRYWSLELFRQGKDRLWQALILGYLREQENLVLVMIDEIAFRCPVRFQRHVQLGEWVQLQVAAVDPRADLLDLREVSVGVAQ